MYFYTYFYDHEIIVYSCLPDIEIFLFLGLTSYLDNLLET